MERVKTFMQRALPLFTAILVTWIWSSSYFLNAYAFEQGMGPFTLSGLRFLIGSAVLATVFLPVYLKRRNSNPGKSMQIKSRLPIRTWILLGLTGYTAAQGLQYMGQTLLEPTQVSLLLSTGNTLLVLGIDRFHGKESRDRRTWLGAFIMIMGVGLFYFPWNFNEHSGVGIAFVGLSSIGYALHLTLNRKVLLEDRTHPFWLTLIPMAIGGSILLIVGLAFEEMPRLHAGLIGIVFSLGIVNGAAAFLLWTWSQRFLAAADNSLINNLMLVEIALLDILLLGRIFDVYQWIAIAVVSGAVLVVQLRPRR